MATPSIKRFQYIVGRHSEGRCPKCKTRLEDVTQHLQGVGDYAALTFKYCQTCELYYTDTDKNDDS